MEEFLTSGGLSLLPHLFQGNARNIDLKTIHYTGPCERIRALLELGFGLSEPITVGSNVLTSKEFFLELFKKRRMADTGKDESLCWIDVTGVRHGKKQYFRSSKIIDFFDDNHNITACMQMGTFSVSTIAQLLGGKRIGTCGVIPPEMCAPSEDFLGPLAGRGIKFDESSLLLR